MQANVFGYMLQASTYRGVFVVACVGIPISYIMREAKEPVVISEEVGAGRALRDLGTRCLAAVVGLVFLQIDTLRFFASPSRLCPP